MKPRFTYYLAVLAVLFYCLAPAGARAQVLRGTFAMGYNYSLSIHADGTLWATGGNEYGQLGDGTTTDRSNWVQVGTATNWVQVTIGSQTSLGLRTDGSLWAWGYNQFGQLATTTNLGSTAPNATPVQVPGTYTQVASGGTHVLALRADGSLWAWGFNLYGQLGTTPSSANGFVNPVPTQVAGTYTQIAASSDCSLALRADGSLWSWGSNYFGQLGIVATAGTSSANPMPTQVPGTYTQVSAGLRYSLALRADGTLWAWGVNDHGQLGTTTNLGTTAANPVPTQVPGTYTQVQAGILHSLALSASGTLYAWGTNQNGQLGTTTNVGTSVFSTLPTALPGTYVQAASGTYCSLGLRADGTLWGWGTNQNGQLGTSAGTSPSSAPLLPTATGTAVVTRSTATSVGTGLAIRGDGTLWAWGGNSGGLLGNPTMPARTRPGQIGSDNDWVQVVAGSYTALALKANGTVWAWGNNSNGQLGQGNVASVATLVQVPLSTPVVQLAIKMDHALALTASGQLYAWGSNALGQAGQPGTAGVYTPTLITSSIAFKQVAAGETHSLALAATGQVYAWGDNRSGQLGTTTNLGIYTPNPTPMLVAGLPAVQQVIAGFRHNLVLTATGTAYAWGDNTFGQVGLAATGSTSPPTTTPVVVAGLPLVKQLASGVYHNLALTAVGTIYTWGYNACAQLAQGTLSTVPSPMPAQEATGNTAWATLGSGADSGFSLVRTASAQTFASAGCNGSGNLGDGTTNGSTRFDRMSPLTSLQPLPVLAAAGGAAFSLAPNPARTQATAVGLPVGSTLAVYDAVGRLVVASASLTFSVAELPAGVYVVRATAPGQAPQTTRLVVQ